MAYDAAGKGYNAGGQAPGYAPPNTQGQYYAAAPGGYQQVQPKQPGYDPEAGGFAGESSYADFANQQVRMGFIRKVYGILSVQLAVTLSFVLMFVYSSSLKIYAQGHVGMVYSAYILTIIVIIALACCGNVRRQYPMNYILLGVFTLCESYLVGVISAYYTTDTVLLAVVMTMGVTIGLTIFAFQTKYDFTMHGGVLFSLLIILIVFGFVRIFVHTSFMNTVYAAFGALLFSAYLVYDTQIIIGGKHKKFKLSPDEYVFAALNLYLDIVNLFLYILMLLGSRK